MLHNYTQATFDKTGKWLSNKTAVVWKRLSDGTLEIAEGETGWALDEAMRATHRGSIENDDFVISSLYDFHVSLGIKKKKENLTIELLNNYIRSTYDKTRRWLAAETATTVWKRMPDGQYVVAEGVTGASLNQAIKKGLRGLVGLDGAPLASSLADYRRKKGFFGTPKVAQAIEAELGDLRNPESRSNNNATSITRQEVTDLFAQLSGDLAARVTDALLLKLQGQPPTVALEHSPRSQPLAAEADLEGLEKPPEPATAPIPAIEPILAATEPLSISIPAQEDRNIKFAAFNSALFAKPDARGDSMLSLLMNADRAFFHNDPIGLKGNLRKFVEVFIHRIMMAADTKYLDSLEILGLHRFKVEKTIRDYGYTCATVEISEAQGRGSSKREPRLEMADMTRAFRDFMSVMSVAKPEVFPTSLSGHVRNIIAAGGDIHLQIKERDNVSEAQLLQNAFELAKWFNGQFSSPVIAAPPIEKIIATLAEAPMEPIAATILLQKPVENFEDDEPPFKIPTTLLKTLGVTEKVFTEEMLGSRGQDYRLIAEFSVQWMNEPPATKQGRNKVYTRLYKEVASAVDTMIGQGQNIQQIIAELNKQGAARYPDSGKSVEWNANLLLRGAVLTSGRLPLEVFALKRDMAVDKTSLASEKPNAKLNPT